MCWLNKKQTVLIFIFLVSYFLGIAQTSLTTERKQIFDYDWKFFLGDTASAGLKDFNDKSWRNLDLPHDWSIEGKINHKNATGIAGGYFPAGIGWYRKSFSVPGEWKGRNVSVYFEGVYMNSEVFINGKSLGIYPYGYSSFSYDLSPYLEYGKDNVIAVRVDNSQQVNCRWYSGSGIYRHVWMIAVDPVHVKHWGVSITTPEVSTKKAKAEIQRVTEAGAKLLQAGRSVIVHTTRSGSDARIAAKLKNNTAKILGTALGKVLRGALEQSKVRRLCIAGGDTSSFAARALGIEALEMIAPLTPGAPLCRAFAPGSSADGLEVVFKGGQVGVENYFGIVKNGKT